VLPRALGDHNGAHSRTMRSSWSWCMRAAW
jgi:hypothetical protein